MNPAYSAAAWRATLPVLQRSLVAAAAASGARIVVLENVYSLGDLGGRPGTEETPVGPRGPKGRARAAVFDAWFEAHARGEVAVVMGRGSDFFGPRGTQTFFEGRFWTRVLAGKSARLLVSPDQWEVPFVIDDSRFQARFNQPATPLDQAARETVAWATREYGGR